jgi:hypothetical protein
MRTWRMLKFGVLCGAKRMSSWVEFSCFLNIDGRMSPPRWSSRPVARWQVPSTFSSWMSAPETGSTWVPKPSSPSVPVIGSSARRGVVGVDRRLVAGDERGPDDAAVGHIEHAEGAVLVFHRELAAGVAGHEIDLAGRQVGDVGGFPLAEAVGFLRLLAAEAEPGGEHAAVLEREVDLDRIRLRQGEAQALGIGGNLVVVHGEAGVEDHLVEPVQRRAAEAELLAFRRQRRGGREGGDAEDQVVVRIDIAIEGEVVAGAVPDVVLEVEVRAVGAAVGEHFAAGHAERVEAHCGGRKSAVGVLLHGKSVAAEKREVLDELRGLVEIDQDADAAALGGLENGAEQGGPDRRGETRGFPDEGGFPRANSPGGRLRLSWTWFRKLTRRQVAASRYCAEFLPGLRGPRRPRSRAFPQARRTCPRAIPTRSGPHRTEPRSARPARDSPTGERRVR